MKIEVANATEESIRFLDGKAIVVKQSGFTGKFHRATLALTDSQYSLWLSGELIQRALPHLNAEEREFLMTGVTPQEWHEAFGDEE